MPHSALGLPTMTAFPRQNPDTSTAARVVLGTGAAVLAGIVTAWNPLVGLGLLAAGTYAVVALRDLQTALVMWVPSFFISFFIAGNLWLKGGLAVALIAVGAMLRSDSTGVRRAFRDNRTVLTLLTGVLTWFALTAIWAAQPGQAVAEWLRVLLCATVFVLVLLAVRTPRHALHIVIAFIGAGVFSALLGLAGISTGPVNPDAAPELAAQGRITAWAGDPNVLAASLVATTVLCLTLIGRHGQKARPLLGLSAAVAIVGVAATQSRGGLVAAGVALVAGLIVFRRQASRTVPIALAVVVVLVGYFAADPGAAKRITASGDAGSGRSELWTVALRGFRDHPVHGIGLNQFRLESSRYVLEPGTLRYVRLISERPVVVHNTYLQYLVEAGAIGILLFVGFVLACLSAYLAAIRAFEAAEAPDGALLARGLFVATVSTLAAGLFFSAGGDYKTWLMLALGPALLAAARANPFPKVI